jgi:hypothetical protein
MRDHFRHLCLKSFPSYKELFNPISFDLSNCSLKIQESIETSIPKVAAHLGVCGFIPSRSPTLLGVWMWLLGCIFGSCLSIPFVLVANPRLRSWQNITNVQGNRLVGLQLSLVKLFIRLCNIFFNKLIMNSRKKWPHFNNSRIIDQILHVKSINWL